MKKITNFKMYNLILLIDQKNSIILASAEHSCTFCILTKSACSLHKQLIFNVCDSCMRSELDLNIFGCRLLCPEHILQPTGNLDSKDVKSFYRFFPKLCSSKEKFS